MATENGSATAHHMIDKQFESFKARVHDVVDRADAQTAGVRSRLRVYAAKTGDAIKAHPFAAVGIALGVGYAIVRIARR
jgi:ElaB/YqjD/DUF883 family membrane-anchored ribosome-binding protein